MTWYEATYAYGWKQKMICKDGKVWKDQTNGEGVN